MEKTFRVNGMKCPHCKAKVENALCELPGVSEAEASLDNHNVKVNYDDTSVSEEQMKEAVDNAGHYEMEI